MSASLHSLLSPQTAHLLKLPVLKQRGFQRFGPRFQFFSLKEKNWLSWRFL
ncbi:hypothetical protein KSX_58280 [Ktedonospora formicarum]|uniref:Uncharacterized protein n=1 Tax=Ktedonospora formicarum TaxID=2778364 RepID=A0A8J3MTZ1_9CHLR|nr:hypothetical protein KSX_58280 [Ktedonospora formicarum]